MLPITARGQFPPQPGRAPPRPVPGGARPGGFPGGALQPGGRGNPNARGGVPTQGKVPAGKAAPKKKDDAKKAPAIDNETLPKGYVVPPDPPRSLTVTEELLVEPWGDDRKTRRAAFDAFMTLLTKGAISSDDDKRTIEQFVEWYLAQMTLAKFRERGVVPDDDKDTPTKMTQMNVKEKDDFGQPVRRYKDVPQLREQLRQWIENYPAGKTAPRDVRRYLMEMIVKHAPKLFEYHFVARLSAAILLADLSEINVTEGDAKNEPERFSKAGPALLRLIEDHQQDVAVRNWGVIGLKRIVLLRTDVKLADRQKIIESLVGALQNSTNDFYWYPWRIVESLGQIGVAYTPNKRPEVAQALAEVLVDKNRDPMVRAEAAQSLGRLQYNSDVDLGLIAHEIAGLAQEMGEAYVKTPQRASWKRNFLRIYSAFKPLTDEDAAKGTGLLAIVNKGAFASHKKTVQDAYDMVLPVAERVIKGGAAPIEALGKLGEWLKTNPPKNNKIAESEPPIVGGAQSAQPSISRQPAGDKPGAG